MWRSPTLLCTSQGLVIADKSQPVIIMALQVTDRQWIEDDNLLLMQTDLNQSPPHNFFFKSKLERVNSAAVLSSLLSYIHDNFLPDGVVGDESNGLLLIRHWLRGIYNVLEHCSLSVWRQTDERADSQWDRQNGATNTQTECVERAEAAKRKQTLICCS